VPLDRMMLETDSPYLAPMPYRGKENEPSFVEYVAKGIALLRGASFEEIAEATTENAKRFFKLRS
ncbi:MAG: TatD family hydrolase, partial [Patescibacteria group bacterium]